MSLQNVKKLNKLLDLLPEGVAVPSKWLLEQNYSRQLVRKYVQGGWLKPLGRSVFARPQIVLNWQGLVLGIQYFARLPFHVGGLSALNLQGFAHYLPLGELGANPKEGHELVHLWGQGKVPAWVQTVALSKILHFHKRQLFVSLTPADGLEFVPSGVRDFQIQISTPERAIMEVLYDVGDDEHSFTHAFELFEGLTSLRPKVVNKLLQHCSSIKVKRLFLFMADQLGYPWISRIEKDQLNLGSGRRLVVKGGKLDKDYLITVPRHFNA